MASTTTQDRRLSRLSQLLKTLRETVVVSDLLAATTPFLAQEMGYSLVWYGLHQPTENCLVGHEGLSPSNKRLLHQERIPLDQGELLEQVFFQRRPVHVPDLAQERHAGKWKAIARANRIQSTLLFPIHYLNVCYGVVVLGLPEWGMTPQQDDIAMLSMVCGQLAVALHQTDSLKQAEQQKRPAAPLLRSLDQLRAQPSLQQRFETIVDETHQFVGTSSTLLYWFNPQKRCFWPRATRCNPGAKADVTLAVADCERFYQALKGDRILSISDTDSALQAEISSYLQSQWQVRSLMVAPIGSEGHVLGFLAVAAGTPHLWSEGEKHFLQGITQLATLVTPLEKLEQTLDQGQADQAVLAQLGSAVRNLQDWPMALRQTSEYLLERLGVDRLIVLQGQDEGRGFPIVFQHQAPRRKRLGGPLGELSSLDRSLLNGQSDGVVIEDWQSDLRLMHWRSQLAEKVGVRALMACPVVIGAAHMGVLLATCEQSRGWSAADQHLLRDVARQLATLLHQRSLKEEITQLQSRHQSLQWGLSALQQESDPERIDPIAVRAIAQLLKAPWVALLSWSPHDGMAKVGATYATNGQWRLPDNLQLDSITEPLLQQLAQSPQPLTLSVEALPAQSRTWLNFPQLKQLLSFNLLDPSSDIPQGALLVGESHRRPWGKRSIELAQLLVQQLSWSRRSASRMLHGQHRQGQLEQLNWYKQACGERLQLNLRTALSRLQADSISLSLASRQTLEQLETALEEIQGVFQEEEWDLQIRSTTTPLISLLKQTKQQLDPLISARQLWCQFHWADVQQCQIQGDVLKLAGILQSVLVAACQRCLLGGRVDVWCKALPDEMLEFSVTDNGMLDPRLLAALQPDADKTDPLYQELLENNPGLSLRLSQSLLGQLGGEFELLTLEDGRTVTRLLIPGLQS